MFKFTSIFIRIFLSIGLFCGGHNSFWELNFGKCGICGDAFESKQPRPHEVGGKFVTKPPTIVQTYEQGDIIDVVVNLTANHGGFFIFQLCPVDNPEKEATEDCLNDHNLEIVRKSPKINLNLIETNLNNSNSLEDLEDSKDNSYESYDSLEINNEIDFNLDTKLIKTVKRFNLFNPVDLDDHSYDKFKYNVPMESPRSYNIKVKLPNEINCKRCVFRWIYVSNRKLIDFKL